MKLSKSFVIFLLFVIGILIMSTEGEAKSKFFHLLILSNIVLFIHSKIVNFL